MWASKADFEAWTKSEQFRRAHARAGNDGNAAPLYLGHPKFEGFEVKQTLAAQGQGRLMQLAAAKPDLASALAADPGAVIETVAKEHGVTTRAVVEALPAGMRSFAPASAFIDAMKDIATWGEVTLIVHTDDGIMEFTGPIPAGEVGRGYFNLMGRTGFHGHLRHERCAGLAFMERPFMGRLSASIVFFNVDGGIMFKVFVGRDEKRELLADQLAKFRALAERVGARA